jgi:hypothetical protein
MEACMSRVFFNWFWVIVFALSLPMGVVLSTHLARRSFEKVKLRDQTITVKGYAEQPIVSDLAQWSARITARAGSMVEAAEALRQSYVTTQAMLAPHGFDPASVELAPVQISILYTKDDKGHNTNQIEGYVLRQSLTITSGDVRLIATVARDAAALIAQGVELEAHPPTYLYTRLDDLKLDMIGQATANARQRAEQLVSASTSRVGPLRSASQGVFQITPAFSTEVSGSGMNDTATIDKVIKAVVTVEYALDSPD